MTLAWIACLCFETGVCPWPNLSSLFQYTSPTRVVSLHLIPRIHYHPGIPVTLLTGSSSSLIKLEIDFLEENLDNCSVENQYFLGYFGGKRDEFEDMLERFLLISFTCFVKKALHSKDLNQKRFPKNDRQFLLN